MLPVKLFRQLMSTVSTASASSPSFSVLSSLRSAPGGKSSCVYFRALYSSSADLDVIKQADSELAKVEATEGAVTVRGPLPLITKRELEFVPFGREPRQAWVENLDTLEETKLGLVDLHPDVWGTFPRIELIHANIKWQLRYKKVNWDWAPTRGEAYGTKKKPWPQKGLGKARHGSRKSPIWMKGAKAHGPRGPKTSFYMLPFDKRIHGLCSTLSVKLAQDDLKIVDTLEIPTDDPQFLQDLAEKRHWGMSVLFVDDTDIAPTNIALSTGMIPHMNIMPVYGLNVHSMLKHETLVLTLAAVNKIEDKLVLHLNRNNPFPPTARKIRHGGIL